jgi:hypothetical protein
VKRDAKWEAAMRERVRLGDQPRLVLHDYYETLDRPDEDGIEIVAVEASRYQPARIAHGPRGAMAVSRGMLTHEISITAIGSYDAVEDFVDLLKRWNHARQQERVCEAQPLPESFRSKVITALEAYPRDSMAVGILHAHARGAPLLDLIAVALPRLLDSDQQWRVHETRRLERQSLPMTVMKPERLGDHHLASCECRTCRAKRLL